MAKIYVTGPTQKRAIKKFKTIADATKYAQKRLWETGKKYYVVTETVRPVQLRKKQK